MGRFAGTATFVDVNPEHAHRVHMDEFDVFSPESEAQVCEQVLGDARHGLDTAHSRDRAEVLLGASTAS
ncbi:hypothetical protein FHX44_112535 [Pseudonocardia hierapolitana]|uniref:Uncharacterized protein n=1 Tax=Pseudonocardia hierapolitana TaxID=1128676 RepID=A0A561SP50_9PSEU|nr:hypothetical protein FHX44_112535 [Pseudonocardia hierapolitana]